MYPKILDFHPVTMATFPMTLSRAALCPVVSNESRKRKKERGSKRERERERWREMGRARNKNGSILSILIYSYIFLHSLISSPFSFLWRLLPEVVIRRPCLPLSRPAKIPRVCERDVCLRLFVNFVFFRISCAYLFCYKNMVILQVSLSSSSSSLTTLFSTPFFCFPLFPSSLHCFPSLPYLRFPFSCFQLFVGMAACLWSCARLCPMAWLVSSSVTSSSSPPSRRGRSRCESNKK